MPEIPVLSNEEIEARVGEQSFDRGLGYFKRGAIFDTRRAGMTLKASCEGRSADAYRVEVTFGPDGIVSADCSCPVGAGGHCKHTAALLLTWRESPGEFVAVEETDAVLARMSREQLVALVKQMLDQEPDLESLIEAPLPAGDGRQASPDAEVYRRKAETAIRRGGYGDYRAASGIASELASIAGRGSALLEQSNWPGAAAVYQGVLEAIAEDYESIGDDEGETAGVSSECIEGLAGCLSGETEPATRESILQALFAIYTADYDAGGYGLSEGAPGAILEHATAEERHRVAVRLREKLAGSSGWTAKAYGGFLLDLEADTLSDEEYLRISREAGRLDDLVQRLLQLGRVEDAVAEVERAGDYGLLQTAGLFGKHGREEVAEKLILERSLTSKDLRLVEWLKQHAIARSQPEAALTFAERLFRERPSLAGYQELRELAGQVGCWEALRPDLLAALQGRRDVLAQVYIDEGDIDQALEVVKQKPAAGLYHYGPDVKLEVARAAEAERPRAAADIYRQHVETLIRARGRDSYRTACEYLKKVRDLYQRLGAAGDWSAYVARLREENRSLRAFQEELRAAGLA